MDCPLLFRSTAVLSSSAFGPLLCWVSQLCLHHLLHSSSLLGLAVVFRFRFTAALRFIAVPVCSVHFLFYTEYSAVFLFIVELWSAAVLRWFVMLGSTALSKFTIVLCTNSLLCSDTLLFTACCSVHIHCCGGVHCLSTSSLICSGALLCSLQLLLCHSPRVFVGCDSQVRLKVKADLFY